MNKELKDESAPVERPSHQMHVPGWLVKEEIGLGDVMKRVTYRAGIKPCTGCEKRAAALNRWMGFSPRKS